MTTHPSPLSDFVNTYDEVSHDDWDPENDLEIWDEYDEPEYEEDEEGELDDNF